MKTSTETFFSFSLPSPHRYGGGIILGGATKGYLNGSEVPQSVTAGSYSLNETVEVIYLLASAPLGSKYVLTTGGLVSLDRETYLDLEEEYVKVGVDLWVKTYSREERETDDYVEVDLLWEGKRFYEYRDLVEEEVEAWEGNDETWGNTPFRGFTGTGPEARRYAVK